MTAASLPHERPPTLTLYGYWRSSSSYRVRFALAAKGLSYTYTPVNLLADEQASPAFKARSPMGYVPCLLVDGEPLVESVAIVEYLEERFPAPPLYPRDPIARAHLRAFVEVINAGSQPLHNLNVLRRVSSDAAAQQAWARHFLERGLRAIESAIELHASRIAASRSTQAADGVDAPKAAGPFAFGPSLSAADIFLVPHVYSARRFDVDLAPYPRVLAAEQAALATDAAKAALPENQRDAPKAAT